MLIVDTGPIVAAADTADRDHEACLRLLSGAAPPLVVSPLVVAEAAYLLGRQLGPMAEAEFFRSICDGDLLVEPMTTTDLRRIADLVEAYADLGLGGTDASVIAIAERFGRPEIATLDHRHFSVVRPAHVVAFRLLP
ncbi:MAG: PIN domain-containing protein [Acidimicrobiia bacterium]|nr:PIN domain-containing protein [Acidimicrobiia bacterium]